MYIDWKQLADKVAAEVKDKNHDLPDWDDKYESNGGLITKAFSGSPEILTNVEPHRVPFSLLKATEADLDESVEGSTPLNGMSPTALEAYGVVFDDVSPDDGDFVDVAIEANGGYDQLRCGAILHIEHRHQETRNQNPNGIKLFVARIERDGWYDLTLVPCELIDWEKLPVVFTPNPLLFALLKSTLSRAFGS